MLAVVGWFTLYIWENVFMGFDDDKIYSTSVRLLSSLNPLVALALGLRLVGQFEAQGESYLVQPMAFIGTISSTLRLLIAL